MITIIYGVGGEMVIISEQKLLNFETVPPGTEMSY